MNGFTEKFFEKCIFISNFPYCNSIFSWNTMPFTRVHFFSQISPANQTKTYIITLHTIGARGFTMIRDNRSTKRSVIIPKGEGVVWVSHIREAWEMLKVKIPLRLRNPERRMGRVYQIAKSRNSNPKSPKSTYDRYW